jgi:hypothetical protein
MRYSRSSRFLRQRSFVRARTVTAVKESGREKELEAGLYFLDLRRCVRGYRGDRSKRG